MELLDKRYDEGCLDIETGRLDSALEIFKDLISENPDNYQAINKLGVVYANKKQLDKAEECFIRALEIEQYFGPALVNMGNIFEELGDGEEAEKYYKESIEYEPDYYMAYYNLSVLYKKRGHFDKYMKYIKEYKRSYKRHINNQNSILGKRSTVKIIKSTRILYIIVIAFFVAMVVKVIF